jgi:predicted ATPase
LQLAYDLAADFPDGIAFVALAPLQLASLVPQVIAQRLHLHEQEDTPQLEQVSAYLQRRHFLLVLDNFEHLLEAVTYVADLLETCPHLHVLVTSRAPLRLRAELAFPLAPLALDEAATLFQERAQAVRPAGTYNEATVTAICERLDRLPLAIELAAMQVHLLSLPDLLERLTIRLPFLRGGARDLPARQQTMRDAIAWSYELLAPPERQCFRALGVFVGGSTLEAAKAVCWAEGESPAEDPFLTLAALVDASLVQVETPAEGGARFSLLEVLREFALERLREAGEEELCRRRHASYFARLAESVAPFGPGPGVSASQLVQDFPNGRVALQWAKERQEVALGLWLAGAFGRFWLSHGHLHEAEAWLEQMLALDKLEGMTVTPPEIRATALYCLGDVLLSLDKLERASALASAALDNVEHQENESAVSMTAFSIMGAVARRQGRLSEAVAYFTQSEAYARLAEAASFASASESAAQLKLHESIRGTALLNRVDLAEMQGNLVLAARLTEEGREHAKAIGVPFVVAGMTTRLGHLARQQGNFSQAKGYFQEALALFRAFGSPTFIAWCMEGLAATLDAEGAHIQATRLCAAAATLRDQAQTPLPMAERAAFEQVVASCKAALRHQTFAGEWAVGTALTQDQALTYALSHACA